MPPAPATVGRAFPIFFAISGASAAIVNKAARILEEGIAASPSDIDLVLIDGYGYPRGAAARYSTRTGGFFRQERSET